MPPPTFLGLMQGPWGLALCALAVILSSILSFFLLRDRLRLNLYKAETDRLVKFKELEAAHYDAETYRILMLRHEDRLDKITDQPSLPFVDFQEIIQASARNGGRQPATLTGQKRPVREDTEDLSPLLS